MKNNQTVMLVIGVLGLVAVLVVLGGIILTLDDKSLPESLIAIGSLAVGAVAGILSKTNDNDDVRITNTPADPVPVSDRGVSTLGIAVAALVIACVCLALLLL